MKRFRSSLQSIQRVLQQQLRMAELNLAHVIQTISQLELKIQRLELEGVGIEQDLMKQLSVHNTPRGNTVRTSRVRLSGCQADIRNQSLYREKLLESADKLKAEYRTLKARSDGVDQIIETRRQEHRRQAALAAQTELEDSARSLRMLDGNKEILLNVEDRVIQR